MSKQILLLSSIIALWIFTGCSSSDIHYNGQQVTLKVDKTLLQIEGKAIGKRRQNFSSLYLSQEIIRTGEGSLIVYENAQTDTSYEFQFTPRQIVTIVFDAVNSREVYATSKIQVLQLLLQNGGVLNLIVQQNETQQIKFLYGMSAKQLDHLLAALQAHVNYTPYRKVITLHTPHHAIESRWNDWKVHFIPLVIPYQTMLLN